jgi:chemotaxis response regulator CheB
VYVGQAKEHLAVDGDRISLLPDPHRLRNLQAIDELFQSIAQSAGKHSIGIILSGLLHDGAEGLKAIKEANGLAIVQSPEEAAFAGMPRRALEAADVDFVATVEQIIVLVRRMAAFYDC